MNRKKSGFTLVELIVVIAIIGILATIAIPKMEKYIIEARAKTNIANARTIYTTVMAYNMEHLNEPSIQYLDYSSYELFTYPNLDYPQMPHNVATCKSVFSEYLPDSLKFVTVPMAVVGDDLFFVSSFPDRPLSSTSNPNEIISICYFDPRMPITSLKSYMLGNNNLAFSGTAFVDGRAIVVTNLRFMGTENELNPALYPTVEEYLQEYNEYMKNKETN